MPASARKSSVGNIRRGPQKYIPYRADDFQHGKKTGIAVAYVDHTDEFEPFEKVMSQADQRTPFRVQGARKKRGPKTPVPPVPEFDDDDENGEMSMELDDSACPNPHFRRFPFPDLCPSRHAGWPGCIFRAYTRQSDNIERAARWVLFPPRRPSLGR